MNITRSTKKEFFGYLGPSVGAMMFFSIYIMIDGMFVGKGVGTDALAAVNTAMPLINTLFAVSLMVSVGASTWITFYLGAGEVKKANQFFTLNVLLLLLIAIISTVMSVFFIDDIVRFLGANADTFAHTKDYLRIIMIFSTFFMISYSLEVMVKADGFPKYAFFYVFLAAIINITLDYIFIIHYSFGIKGAAYATGIAQLVSSLAFLSHFLNGTSTLKFVVPKVTLRDVKKIIVAGLPEALTEFSLGFTIFIFNFLIMRTIGTDGLAAFGVLMYVNSMAVTCAMGINQSMQPLVGYYLGKNRYTKINELLRLSVKTSLIFSLIFLIISQLFAKEITSLFIAPGEKEAFKLSIEGLRFFSIGFILSGLNILLSGYFTARRSTKYAGIMSLSRGYILIVPVLFIMQAIWERRGIWSAVWVYELVTLLIGWYLFKKFSKA